MTYEFKGENKALISSINALLALDAKGALVPHGIGEMARDLLEACAARLPAPQHQSEPVAWLARAVDADGTTYRQCVSTSELTERDAKFAWGEGVMNRCSVVITPLGPLADPGEVERLRVELDSMNETFGMQEDKIDAIRAKLAEAQALLREAMKRINVNQNHEFVLAIDAHLSAIAEPSAPKCKACGDTGTIDDTSKDELPDGLYVERGLVACTACESLDEPTDLATWKRRAIEAESKLRTYDPQVVELGERAMQALLAEPTPKELVLTKFKLCDQLQADLTERDEEVDRLRAAIAKARKTICLPKSIESLLDSAMEQRP
ncbi:hypothetical protein [Pseudomonas juntendi]|uniref:hypothetical protein n=1 Tax=Pseudomonas juntendi TaxID=2666183 RepID=UPI001E3EF2AF|nr:hypothetical protein [Pseudomonas juntendi]MDH0042414.1 hypothetical protein [Pseudomonas juntendi]MDM3889632.1 hypothetical protein [Pseudomonas juntendi]